MCSGTANLTSILCLTGSQWSCLSVLLLCKLLYWVLIIRRRNVWRYIVCCL